MLVYLACTVRGDRSGLDAARAVAVGLQARGHVVLTSHLLADNVERAEGELSEAQVYERDKRWLDECDVLVAEASGSTFGVGFEVGYVTGRAAQSGQHVIVLFDEARRSAVSRLISGYSSPCGVSFGYRAVGEAERFVTRWLATLPGIPGAAT